MSEALILTWAGSNLITGLAYLLIPREIWKWYAAVPDENMGFLALLFGTFILSCGLHHLVMPFTPGHVEWLNLATDVPMAIISVGAYLTLYRSRDLIIRWLNVHINRRS